MIQLHEITDKPTGWIQLVKSLVRVVPIEHPMGPSVITLLLDDSPLPTKDSVLEVADMITHTIRRTPRKERNLCVILGCLAEKLAGPSSVAVLSETTLGYLLGNLVSFMFLIFECLLGSVVVGYLHRLQSVRVRVLLRIKIDGKNFDECT